MEFVAGRNSIERFEAYFWHDAVTLIHFHRLWNEMENSGIDHFNGEILEVFYEVIYTWMWRENHDRCRLSECSLDNYYVLLKIRFFFLVLLSNREPESKINHNMDKIVLIWKQTKRNTCCIDEFESNYDGKCVEWKISQSIDQSFIVCSIFDFVVLFCCFTSCKNR